MLTGRKTVQKERFGQKCLTAQGFNVKDRVLLTVFFLYFQLYLSENMLLKNASPLARKQFQNVHVCGQVSKSVNITLTMLKPYPCFSLNRTTLANFLLNSY